MSAFAFTRGPRRTFDILRLALKDHIEDKLSAMAIPRLVVRGAYDPIALQPWDEELTRRLPQGHLVVIGGSPHAVNYDAPTALAHVTLAFLEAHPAMLAPTASPIRIQPTDAELVAGHWRPIG